MKIVKKDDPWSRTINLFSGFQSLVYDVINSMIDEMCYKLSSTIHSVCHWLMYHFMKRKEQIICNNSHAIIAILINFSYATPQNRIFLNISHKLRNVYLLRPRSRGSDDDFSLIFK